jgi:hypothetical protein
MPRSGWMGSAVPAVLLLLRALALPAIMPKTGGQSLGKFAFFFLAAAGLAHAETIVSLTGALGGHETLGGSASDEAFYASWTQTTEYDGLSVLAELEAGQPDTSVTAYLMTAAGPGTTTAEQIASTTIIVPDTTDGFVQLFSGLDLDLATYYLVLTANPSAGWGYTFSPIVTTAAGVSAGGDGRAEDNGCGGTCSVDSSYPPASLFADQAAILEFEVQTSSDTPEPGSIFIGTSGCLFLLAAKRRHCR